MSVYSNETTRCYIPEGSHIHSRCRENMKSHRNSLFPVGMHTLVASTEKVDVGLHVVGCLYLLKLQRTLPNAQYL
jgi:hypothetical protein